MIFRDAMSRNTIMMMLLSCGGSRNARSASARGEQHYQDRTLVAAPLSRAPHRASVRLHLAPRGCKGTCRNRPNPASVPRKTTNLGLCSHTPRPSSHCTDPRCQSSRSQSWADHMSRRTVSQVDLRVASVVSQQQLNISLQRTPLHVTPHSHETRIRPN